MLRRFASCFVGGRFFSYGSGDLIPMEEGSRVGITSVAPTTFKGSPNLNNNRSPSLLSANNEGEQEETSKKPNHKRCAFAIPDDDNGREEEKEKSCPTQDGATAKGETVLETSL